MKRGTIVIWVQHLLGIGHTVRAVAIARALHDAGAPVRLLLGAPPPEAVNLDGLSVVMLPPVLATDLSFRTIQSPDGTPYPQLISERRSIVGEAVRDASVFVTEAFPFGRRPFRHELTDALNDVRARGGKAVVSVRDVLVRKPAEKTAAMVSVANLQFDGILCHADPAFIRLDDSFLADELTVPVEYTGFVAPAIDVPLAPEREGVVVSAGGSAVGRHLCETAIEAARRLPADCPVRVLVPPPLAEWLPAWRHAAPQNAVVEPNRPDFRALLAAARVSVSQAGYNTVLDVLSAKAVPVFVPFAAGEESEQTDRANALARRGLATVLPEAALSPDQLAEDVMDALARPPVELPALNLDGARRSAEILMELSGR